MDAFSRIFKEEGPKAFFNGSSPFVNRAMVVGAVQVGTYDQFRETFAKMGVKHVSDISLFMLFLSLYEELLCL